MLAIYYSPSTEYVESILGCTPITRPVLQNLFTWNNLRKILFLQHSWWAVQCQHALGMRYGEEKCFLFPRHDLWFQPSHKLWLGSFMLGTAQSLQRPPGEEGNSLLVRGCILGMPDLHITTEIRNTATTYSEYHARATSIRREKVSPWWEKAFLPWN